MWQEGFPQVLHTGQANKSFPHIFLAMADGAQRCIVLKGKGYGKGQPVLLMLSY